MDIDSSGLGDQLYRRANGPFSASVGARHSGTSAGRAARSCTERRDASPFAGWDDASRDDLEHFGKESAQWICRVASAAERRVDADGDRESRWLAIAT